MKKQKTIIPILVLIVLMLLLQPRPLSILAGPGGGTIEFKENRVDIDLRVTHAIGNPRGTVLICGPEVSDSTKNTIKDWVAIDKGCWADAIWVGCGDFEFYQNHVCMETGYIEGDGIYTNWQAKFKLIPPTTTTTTSTTTTTTSTTTTTLPNGNGNGNGIPITALLLLAGLGFIIIKGKKWLR